MMLAMYMPGIPELLIIALIFLMFFGIGKLPKAMKDLGKGMRSFRNGFRDELEREED